MKQFLIWLWGSSVGMSTIYAIYEQNKPITPDTTKYLHGYTLDLPEEITLADSTDCLGVSIDKEKKVIYISFKH